MSNTFLVLIDGPMGSGKTTTSKLLSQRLPDAARVALPDIKRLVPNYNENEKTLLVIRDVIKVMVDKYLEHGVSVIIEQITKSNGAEALKVLAQKHNARFYAFRLNAPEDIRLKRVLERTREMMNVPVLNETKINEMTGYFLTNNQFYLDNPISIAESFDTQVLSPEQIVNEIVNRLS